MRIDRGLRATCLRLRVDPPKGLVSTFLLRQDRLGRGKGWIAGGIGECESRIASLELRVWNCESFRCAPGLNLISTGLPFWFREF